MLTVDAYFLNITTCEHDYSCLTTGKCGNRNICDVRFSAGEYVLFINNIEQTTCNFRMTYGYGHICTCPTRYGIYRTYMK